jgi:hypothetical protein
VPEPVNCADDRSIFGSDPHIFKEFQRLSVCQMFFLNCDNSEPSALPEDAAMPSGSMRME